ncbi:hypothetical protein [Candidatus Methylobacter favarea]|nr:hypothetical protein [Candidatus Methylobacter favarea]
MHHRDEMKNPIEGFYFDNQIGIIKVIAYEPADKKKPLAAVTDGAEHGDYQFGILEIIAARDKQEALMDSMFLDLDAKIKDFFEYVRTAPDGK